MEMENYIFGVVVLNYFDYETTIRFIDKNIKKDNNVKYVIVDNCSPNDSFSVLTKYCKNIANVDVIKSFRNGGYSYGNNYGMKYLINNYNLKYIVIANPDTEFSSEVFDKLDEGFKKTDFSVLSPLMRKVDGSLSETPFWSDNSYFEDLISCFYLGRKFLGKRSSVDYSKEIQPVDILPGSFWAIRKEDICKINYLDEGTFLYCEERILSRRLHNIGLKEGLITTTSYTHAHSQSIASVMKVSKSWRLILNSRCYYHSKYNKINIVQVCLLKICSYLSFAEKVVEEKVKHVRKKKNI